MTVLNSSRRAVVGRLLGVVCLLAIATFATLPNYLSGNWVWENPPGVPQQSQLHALVEDGLTIPGWQTIEQSPVDISGQRWRIQALVPAAVPARISDPGAIAPTEEGDTISATNPAIVLLRPQTWHRDMPQVEWMDLNGIQQWTADQRGGLRFAVSSGVGQNGGDGGVKEDGEAWVRARFFRGWSRQQTYAVVQWYAWPRGGSPSPSRWFWADQWTQLRDRHRLPWVAVSVMLPIKPLGDSRSAQSKAEALCQQVQTSLMQNIFSDPT